jgi:protein-S-isoprenylcysteine O-methyltransferase Ste14
MITIGRGNFMKEFYRRWIVSLMLPFVFLLVFPVAVIVFKDTNRIPLLAEQPMGLIASSLGVFLILSGLALLFVTIPLFLKKSDGTNMPWEPATELIVEGVYRHVRNPMHMGVFLVMLGEGLVLRSKGMLSFTWVAALLHLFYIPLSEERGLERRFGQAYRNYKAHVPRWIPRWTPWTPEENKQGPLS